MFLYNDPKFKDRRSTLRRSQTPEEKILWEKLRNKGLGVKFFRQYSVGPYILDFYCPVKRLALELDGEHHNQDKEYDRQRDDYLKLNDIKVFRFWNTEVNGNIEGLIEKIKEELGSSPYVRGGKEGL